MNNLKSIMKERDISVTIMCLDTGFCPQTIYGWQRKGANPKIYNARVIATYLNLNDNEIWQ